MKPHNIADDELMFTPPDRYPPQPAPSQPASIEIKFEKVEEVKVKKVPVTLYVMSKCPDAEFCESHFSKVLDKIGNVIDLSTDYIANIDASRKYKGACMHDDDECLGNIQQLCVRKYYPDPKNWFNFILCQNKEQYSIPDSKLFKSCAEANGINADDGSAVVGCINSTEGTDLFVESIKRKNEAEANKSCSIFVSGKLRCIHDGYWYSCPKGSKVSDFVKDICKEYKEANGGKESKSCLDHAKDGIWWGIGV